MIINNFPVWKHQQESKGLESNVLLKNVSCTLMWHSSSILTQIWRNLYAYYEYMEGIDTVYRTEAIAKYMKKNRGNNAEIMNYRTNITL